MATQIRLVRVLETRRMASQKGDRLELFPDRKEWRIRFTLHLRQRLNPSAMAQNYGAVRFPSNEFEGVGYSCLEAK